MNMKVWVFLLQIIVSIIYCNRPTSYLHNLLGKHSWSGWFNQLSIIGTFCSLTTCKTCHLQSFIFCLKITNNYRQGRNRKIKSRRLPSPKTETRPLKGPSPMTDYDPFWLCVRLWDSDRGRDIVVVPSTALVSIVGCNCYF